MCWMFILRMKWRLALCSGKGILNRCLGFRVSVDRKPSKQCAAMWNLCEWAPPWFPRHCNAECLWCPRPGWRELWATWATEMSPAHGSGLELGIFEVPSSPGHFIYGWVTLFLGSPKSENVLTWCTNTFFLLFPFSSQWANKKLEL